jgi:hypothetical protein
MKNHKGVVATLLTLGLVVVGTLITLGSSLFVNNQKTNLASNSMAACPKGVAIQNSNYFKCTASCGKTSSGGCPSYDHNSLDGSCGYCGTVAAPGGTGETLAECEFKGTSLAVAECGGSNNYTPTGCGKTSTGATTYKCKPGFPAAASGTTTGVDCGMTVSFANQDCAYGIDIAGCKPGTAKCKSAPAASSGTSSYQCSEGEPVLANGTCFSTCKANGSTYVSNSQGTGVDGKHYCCCKKTESGKGFDTCYKAYTPGLYGCEAPSSKVVVYAPSMAAVGMDNCSKYNTSSNTSLYFAQAPGAYSDGQCAVVWSGGLDVGAKNQEAQQLIEPPPPPPVEVVQETPPDINCRDFGTANGCSSQCKDFEGPEYSCKAGTGSTIKKWCCQGTPGLRICSNGKAGTCIFGKGASGPALCTTGLQEANINGCLSVPTNQTCTFFKNENTCFAARNIVGCTWDGSKCIVNSALAPLPGAGNNGPAGGGQPGAGDGTVQCSTTPTSCTAGDKNKKYYLSVDSKDFYKDAACTNLIEKFTPVNLTNYCTGQAGTGLAQNAVEGTNTCKVAKEKIKVNKNDVTVEKINDVLINKKPCDHVLVASTSDNIMVFRECPSFLQGSNCTYSCFKDNTQYNCESTFSDPQYDKKITNNVQITVFNNNKTEDLDIVVTIKTNSGFTDVIRGKVPVGAYVSGLSKCNYTTEKLTIMHKIKSSDIFSPTPIEINCGGQAIVSLDN